MYFFNSSLSSNLRCTLTPSNAAKSLNCPTSCPCPQPSLLRIKSKGAYAEPTTSPFPPVSSPGDQDPLPPQLESHVLPSPELTLTKAGHISHPQLQPPTLSSPGMAGGGEGTTPEHASLVPRNQTVRESILDLHCAGKTVAVSSWSKPHHRMSGKKAVYNKPESNTKCSVDRFHDQFCLRRP